MAKRKTTSDEIRSARLPQLFIKRLRNKILRFGSLEKMDSKQVTKEINLSIRPILKAKGFKKFSGRTYWRYESDRIDILNFQSFNSYNADVLGCTTFSFAVNLATFLNYIPSETEMKEKDGLVRPLESQGHFRSGLSKTIIQSEFPREDIWLIDNNGKYLCPAIIDCKAQIEQNAFNWYEQFRTKESVLRILLEDEVDMKGTWGFGNLGSLNRNRLIAYTATELGNNQLAIDKFEKLTVSYKEAYERTNYDYYLDKMKVINDEISSLKTTHSKR